LGQNADPVFVTSTGSRSQPGSAASSGGPAWSIRAEKLAASVAWSPNGLRARIVFMSPFERR
jgi:hypothetical protein